MICLWQRTIKLQSLGSSCKWASNCFAMDFIELSLILDCFGDQITIKNTKTYTIWLEMITRVLNMPIELKGNNYYSKEFKRVNYKLSNSTFWVVINPFQSTIRLFPIYALCDWRHLWVYTLNLVLMLPSSLLLFLFYFISMYEKKIFISKLN